MLGYRRTPRVVFGLASAALVAAAWLGLAGCGAADPPARVPRHAISGTITAERGSTWTVVPTAGGAAVTVVLTPTTRFGRLHQQSSAAQFPVGARVRALGQAQGTTLTARRVLPPLATRPSETPTATPGAAPPTTTTTPATPTVAPRAPATDAEQVAGAAVSAANAAGNSHPGIAVGVAVMNARTGTVTTGSTGAATFESASVVKLFTIVDLLHSAETGAITLSPQDSDDISRALRLSDDDAMDDLWEEYGGTSTVTGIVGLAHLQDTTPPSDPDEWGETVTSPRDVLAVYRYGLTQLSPTDQKTITDGLGQASDTGADGFDQAFGLLAPPRPAGAEAKQGWMSDGDLYLHTTGIPASGSPWIVAVETRQPGSEDWDAARGAVDDVTRALTSGLNQATT